MSDGKIELFTRQEKTDEFKKRFENARESNKFQVLEIQKYRWVTKLHSSDEVMKK